MKTTVKLIGFSVVAAALVAGCTGEGLPGGTGADPSVPGFTVTVTKNGAPVKDRTIFQKKFNNVQEGQFGNSDKVGEGVKTNDQGIAFVPAPADAVSGGGLFGVGYDAANTQYGGNANNVAQANLKDEIQWFTTPAYNLNDKTGKRVSTSFDIGWNTEGFQPSNGGTVTGPNVTFTLTEKQNATKYEVVVNKGNVAGTGSAATTTGALSGTGTTLTWNGAEAGTNNYQAKAFTPAGIAGVSFQDQMATPWLVFTVAGQQ